MFAFLRFTSVLSLAHPRGQGPAELLRSQSEIKKNRYFVDTMTSKVLCDLDFRLNQALKSADDWYNGIMENIQLKNQLFFS